MDRLALGLEASIRYAVSALLEPGPPALPRLGHPAVMEGHDAVLFYRRWRGGDDLPARLAQAMMWTLRPEFTVAAEAISSFHFRGFAGWFDITSGRMCHGVLPRQL
jgi:hypothetical protein